MYNVKLFIVGLLLVGGVNFGAVEAFGQRSGIPGRSEYFGTPGFPQIPSTPTFPSDLGRPSGMPGAGGRLGGLSEYEFTCSNCNRVIATGASRFSADHITKCPHCGVRFSNTSPFGDDPFSNLRSSDSPVNRSSPVNQGRANQGRANQGMSGQMARQNIEFSGLVIVAGFGFFLSMLLIAGGTIFYFIKAAEKKTNRYPAYSQSPYSQSNYGQSPYSGVTYRPPSQQSAEPWNGSHKRS